MSMLKMLNIYKEPLENQNVQVVNITQQAISEVCATILHTVWIKQTLDKTHYKLALQICHINKNSSKSFALSADGVLQKNQYIHFLQYDITIVPSSLLPTILHEFHDLKVFKEPFICLR